MPIYAVCTECDFLRVRGEKAPGTALPKECPKCGSALIIQERGERFEPTYVGRVSRAIQNSKL
jgi:ribosomal protein S27AE